MHTINFWDKLYLSGQKVVLLFFLLGLLVSAGPAYSQNPVLKSRENLVDYDQRLLTYGFTLGIHTSALRLKFSDNFIQNPGTFDTVANINTPNGVGFSIGFLANLRLVEFLDIRVMPKVGFYQYSVNYQNISADIPDQNSFADFTTVDLPIMFKYKSARRKNFRMFYVGGFTPTIDVTGKKQREANAEEGLRLNGDNLSLELGFGTDIYFPLFKFSPEIRYSHGLINVLSNTQNEIGRGFSRMSTQSIALYLIFN